MVNEHEFGCLDVDMQIEEMSNVVDDRTAFGVNFTSNTRVKSKKAAETSHFFLYFRSFVVTSQAKWYVASTTAE